MYVINGREFNITQIGQNKFRNEIKDPKEAQELAKLLHDLDKPIQVVNESADGLRKETLFFNGDRQCLPAISLLPEGQSPSFEHEFLNNATAESAFLENWQNSTGQFIHHQVTFKTNGGSTSAGINYNTVDQSSVQRSEYITQGKPSEFATVKDSAVVGMSQSDFLDHIRTNGLDKNINWDYVAGCLTAPTGFDTLDKFTDYAGAMYASLEKRINNDFTGELKDTQLEMLNAVVNKAVSDYANKFAKQTLFAYSRQESELSIDKKIQIDDKKIYDSIMALADQKKQSYSSYIAANTDYANLEGSDDKWLERDVKFMANALRNAHDPNTYTKGGGTLYNQDELTALGMFADMNDDFMKGGGYGYSGTRYTEETIGLSLAMKYVATETVKDNWNVGDEVKGIIDTATNEFTRKHLIDFNLLEYEKAGNKNSDRFGAMDFETIFAIVDKAKDEYKNNGGDAVKAVKTAGDFAYDLYNKNRNKGSNKLLIRYNQSTDIPEANFWHEFYDDGRGTSYMGKTLDKIRDFVSAAKSKNVTSLKKMDAHYFFNYKSLLGGLYNPSMFNPTFADKVLNPDKTDK